MLSNNQIKHIKELLKEDWIQEDQMFLIIEQIMYFVTISYDDFIKNKEDKNKKCTWKKSKNY